MNKQPCGPEKRQDGKLERRILGWLALLLAAASLFAALCLTINYYFGDESKAWLIFALYWGLYVPIAGFVMRRIVRWSRVFA